MTQQSLFNSVRSYLASLYMFADDEWLSGFVEYLTEDNSETYSESEVQNLAKEQWLLNDLKNICPGSLPANLRNQQKIMLSGRFVLQINAAVDIGTPAYQQYLKLQRVNMENVEATIKSEDKVSSHRMIKLYLTDGVQEVSGIEYKPMRNLSCDITPGCKVLIKGPVECRRGTILLTESAIELLGGEVQEIAASHSLPSLLTRKLGVTITANTDQNTSVNHPRNANVPTSYTEIPTMQNNGEFQSPHQTFEQTWPNDVDVRAQTFVDDDIDVDQLAAIEAEIVQNPGKRPLNANDSNPEKKPKINQSPAQGSFENYPEEEDLMFEDEEYMREMEAKFNEQEIQFDSSRNKRPIEVASEPFIYIKQINDLSVTEKAGKVFKVKAQIMKLLSKLSVGKEGWSLRCAIVDGTGSIEVDFTSDVLSELVGFTPQEMNQIKKEMATKPELKEKAVSALQKAKDTLQVLYCIIELTILEVPKITRLLPFDDTHISLLKKRLECHNL